MLQINRNDFSLSQIWVATIDIPDHQSNTVEASWMVHWYVIQFFFEP